MSWILIGVVGVILLAAALLYARIRNSGNDSPAEIARTERATEKARDATDRETSD